MVPRVVQDAGYTAVGLGVLALQQVQARRRDVARTVGSELSTAGGLAQRALGGVKAAAAPLTSRLEGLPRLPGPVGTAVELGRTRLARVIRG